MIKKSSSLSHILITLIGTLLFTQSFAAEPILEYTDQPTDPVSICHNTATLKYTVKNNVPNHAIPLLSFQLVPTSSTISASFYNDCNNSVPAGGSCNISVVIDSADTNAADQSLEITYGVRQQKLISNTISVSENCNNPGGDDVYSRVFTLNNQCPMDVWVGISGGSALNNSGSTSDTTCQTDADCYSGARCVQTSPTEKQCFWPAPIPPGSDYRLAANNGSGAMTLNFPIPTGNTLNPQNIQWSGGIAARTDCNSATCATANCSGGDGDATGACKPGVGFATPMNAIEFTLQSPFSASNTNPDFYDITLIDGFNVPLSFGPNNVSQSTTNPYICGTAGSAQDSSTPPAGQIIGASSWQFTLPSTDSAKYVWVSQNGSGTSCTNDTPCTANGEVCGLTIPNVIGSQDTVCGKFLGYWTGKQICGLNSQFGAPYNCNSPSGFEQAPYSSYKLTNMYGCDAPSKSQPAPGSCYSNGATSGICCGCTNWQDEGITVPSDPDIVTQCNPPTTNSWNMNVQPTIEWLKQACPSCYIYPYDDKSSTFTCTRVTSPTSNSANYTITFCPGSASGAPNP